MSDEPLPSPPRKPRAPILPSLSELTEDQRKLAAQWMPLAQSEAAKLGKTRTQRQDLLAEFELALLRCAVRYDPSWGYTFRALLTRAFANAAISLHRKTKRKAEIPLLAHDAENAIEPPPARKTQPAPEEPPARPPTARDLARAAAIQALRDGATYQRAIEQGRRFVPTLLRQQVQRWALRAGIRRPNGRTCTGSLEALRIAENAKNRDHAAQILGVTRQTICNWKKNATLRRQTRPVAQCVDSSDTTQMTDRLLHPKPDRLRLQVKASKRTMSDLAHDLCVSDSHLHHLIRTGAWTPQHLRNLRRSLGPEAWEFVSGQTKRIAV